MTAAIIANQIKELCGVNTDGSYIANCILTGATKPTTKLRNMLRMLKSGTEIRTGNLWGEVRINGELKTFAVFN